MEIVLELRRLLGQCWVLEQRSHITFRLCEGRRRKNSIWGKTSLGGTYGLIWAGPQWNNFLVVFKLQIVEVRRGKMFLHQQNSCENNEGAWPWTEQGECYCLESPLWMFSHFCSAYFTLFILCSPHNLTPDCFKGCHVLGNVCSTSLTDL